MIFYSAEIFFKKKRCPCILRAEGCLYPYVRIKMGEMGGGKTEIRGCWVRMKENRMETKGKLLKWSYKKTKLLFLSFCFLDRFSDCSLNISGRWILLQFVPVFPALTWSYKNNAVHHEKACKLQCHTHTTDFVAYMKAELWGENLDFIAISQCHCNQLGISSGFHWEQILTLKK